MKVGDIVIAPEGCEDYLTAGKEYEVVEAIEESTNKYGSLFSIIDDDGDMIETVEKKSAHLKFQSWILSPTTHDNSQDDKTIIK